MSEGAVTSANVTAGVAMREPVMAPEARQKRYEDLIDKTIKDTSKKKLQEVLEESNNRRFSIYDEVEVDGRTGVVDGLVGPFGAAVSVSVRFKDGGLESFDPATTNIRVTKGYPGYRDMARRQFEDAKTGYRLSQAARKHKSNAEGYENMAKHYDWMGDKAQADRERKAAQLHREQEKIALERDAKNPKPVRNKYEESSHQAMLDRNHKASQKIAKAMGTTYRHYYKVPFADKDKAKAAGFKWDATAKLWFMPSEMFNHTASPGHDLGWQFLHTYDTYHDKTHK